jgi:DNA polymerase III subunit chi
MSTDIWFYHLERTGIAEALEPILEKSLERGWRARIQCDDEARLSALDDDLWTRRAGAFLAHQREERPRAERQPILLAKGGGNQNNARVLFLLTGDDVPDFNAWERICVVFDATDQQSLGWARGLWKAWSKDHPCSYWKQKPEGGWQKER